VTKPRRSARGLRPLRGAFWTGPATRLGDIASAGTSGTGTSSAPGGASSVPTASGRACPVAGAMRSKKRSSSTGTGMTRVLFFSAATSTTVCSSRSCSAAGSAAITAAAWASFLDAWYSPSAEMIRARRSRSASACRDIDRFMDSGREASLTSTRSTRIPHGCSVGHLGHGEGVVLHVDNRLDRVHDPVVDDRVHPERDVIPGDGLLGRHRGHHDLHVHLAQPVGEPSQPRHMACRVTGPKTAPARLPAFEKPSGPAAGISSSVIRPVQTRRWWT
jgi:hypothetical protein